MVGQAQFDQTSRLEKQAVVSSFIFSFPNGPSSPPLVALFKRSAQVRTYRHHLAPISGSIDSKDKNPLAAAWRELSEETTLDPSTLILWRTGMPFSFCDESVGREWTVNPFAFRLKSPTEGGRGDCAIKIDWEHEGWEWHDPAAVVNDDSFNGVPHLRESLRRVWFEGNANGLAGAALTTGLEQLQNDHRSGAYELTAIALGIFRELVGQLQEGIGSNKWWETIRMAAWHLVKNGRESMGASTLNALLLILEEMEGILEDKVTGPEKKLEHMLSMIYRHMESRRSCHARVKDRFTSYVQSQLLSADAKKDKITIVTLSCSSTILNSILGAFSSLAISTLEVRVLESRPLFEGVSMSSSILSKFQNEFQSMSKNLQVHVYTDAAAALAARGADLVLLGADHISTSKGVKNKTGSLPLVLSAKHISQNVKVAVLSDLEKVSDETSLICQDNDEENDPNEVIGAWRNNDVEGTKILNDTLSKEQSGESIVAVKNVYFEWVPLSLVDAFISGEGVLDDRRIREQSEQQGKLTSRYFDSLSIWY